MMRMAGRAMRKNKIARGLIGTFLFNT